MRDIIYRSWIEEIKGFTYFKNGIYYKDAEFKKSGSFAFDWDKADQYTGLHDKNENKIFEGDIYHMGDKNIIYSVVWHDSGFVGYQNGTNRSYAGLEHWKDKIEIIGNIHD